MYVLEFFGMKSQDSILMMENLQSTSIRMLMVILNVEMRIVDWKMEDRWFPIY